MNKFRSSKGVSLVRLDFWAPGDMRDWVDREATRAGLHRSEFLRRMILGEMERATGQLTGMRISDLTGA